MRMLCWPALSLLSLSKRLPGGTRKSSKLPAISSCLNFRRATSAMFTKRLTRSPPASALIIELNGSELSRTPYGELSAAKRSVTGTAAASAALAGWLAGVETGLSTGTDAADRTRQGRHQPSADRYPFRYSESREIECSGVYKCHRIRDTGGARCAIPSYPY